MTTIGDQATKTEPKSHPYSDVASVARLSYDIMVTDTFVQRSTAGQFWRGWTSKRYFIKTIFLLKVTG